MLFGNRKAALCAAVLAAVMLCGCSSDDAPTKDKQRDITPQLVMGDSRAENDSADSSEFFENWNGEDITASDAEENGVVFYCGDEIANIWLWDDFKSSVKLGRSAEVSVFTVGEAANIKFYQVENTSRTRFTINRRYLDGDKLTSECFEVSDAKIAELLDGDRTDYYIGEHRVLSLSSQNTQNRSVPFEYKVYTADSDANVSFPMSKVFASYKDFAKYYDDYNDELELSKMRSDMKKYDGGGGFNAHVVFLYGDMDGSDEVAYDVSNVVAGSGNMDIYLKKTMPEQKNGKVGKVLTVVKIPSEYLDDVKPEKVNWIVYSEKKSQTAE